MTLTRRTLLTGAAVSVAAGVVPAQPAAAAAAPAELDYDYPTAQPPPFAHGVASGDPLADRVVLWTRLTLPQAGRPASITVEWEVGTDPALTSIVESGTTMTDAARDWTVKIDAILPQPATTYYYRFRALGAASLTGRTRTAPVADVDQLRFGVVACSSYYSAYFNAYRQLARRNDLDLVLHCGDHIYDYPDEDEWVRSRGPMNTRTNVDFRDYATVDEVRRRYALYYADPDMLALHQQHPISILWDNHDIDDGPADEGAGPPDEGSPPAQDGATVTRAGSQRVFWEWTPSRPPIDDGSGDFALSPVSAALDVPRDPGFVYRSLPYGAMADVLFLDTQSKRDRSVNPPQLLGEPQFDWLEQTTSASAKRARWRVVVNGFPLGQLRLSNPQARRQLGLEAGKVEFYGAWDAYESERTRFLTYLRDNGIGDNLVMTGDAHGNFAWELVEDNGATAYQPVPPGSPTPPGTLAPVGVEFAPTSVGRGGADETIAGTAWRQAHDGSPPYAASTPAPDGRPTEWEGYLAAAQGPTAGLEAVLGTDNPNLRFIEWRSHGYGIVHLTAEAAVLEYWWQPIRTISDTDDLGEQLRIPIGTDRLARVRPVMPTRGDRTAAPAPPPDEPGEHPTPVVPEVSAPALLAVAGLAAGAGLVALRRRADTEQRAQPTR